MSDFWACYAHINTTHQYCLAHLLRELKKVDGTNTSAWKVVADQFGVHWNSVQGAVRQAVDYGFKHREMDSIFCIGIDELSRKKGHVYVTNVYDLEEKQ